MKHIFTDSKTVNSVALWYQAFFQNFKQKCWVTIKYLYCNGMYIPISIILDSKCSHLQKSQIQFKTKI